jgi:hypothetical protein
VQTDQGPYIDVQGSLVTQFSIVSGLDITNISERVQIVINVWGIPVFWNGQMDTEDEAYFNLVALAAGGAAVRLRWTTTQTSMPYRDGRFIETRPMGALPL